jgi:hypothetical protein
VSPRVTQRFPRGFPNSQGVSSQVFSFFTVFIKYSTVASHFLSWSHSFFTFFYLVEHSFFTLFVLDAIVSLGLLVPIYFILDSIFYSFVSVAQLLHIFCLGATVSSHFFYLVEHSFFTFCLGRHSFFRAFSSHIFYLGFHILQLC